MVSLTLITVGFLVATGLVIALARGSTARWERAKRAAVAVRAEASARQTSPAGAMPRRGVAALRSRISRFRPVAVLTRLLPKGLQLRTPGGRTIRRVVGVLRSSLSGGLRGGRWTKGRSAAPSVDGDETGPAVASGSPRAATDIRPDGAAGADGRKLLRRTVPRSPRRALAFLHRSEDPRGARPPRGSSDETPTARSQETAESS